MQSPRSCIMVSAVKNFNQNFTTSEILSSIGTKHLYIPKIHSPFCLIHPELKQGLSSSYSPNKHYTEQISDLKTIIDLLNMLLSNKFQKKTKHLIHSHFISGPIFQKQDKKTQSNKEQQRSVMNRSTISRSEVNQKEKMSPHSHQSTAHLQPLIVEGKLKAMYVRDGLGLGLD